MFVRSKTTPNSPRKSVQVVENYRDIKTGKVKQRILRYVGIAMDDSEEAKLKQMGIEIIAKITVERENISPQLNMFPILCEDDVVNSLQNNNKAGRKPKKRIEDILPVSQVTLDMITEESRVIDGVHEVAGHMYDTLKYNKILRNQKYANVLKDLVLCRISDPVSKLATAKALKRYYDKDHDLDVIYRTMDSVFDKIDNIQLKTFEATASLIPGEVEVILFDVTTLHFESTNVDELRKFGYSKNCRFNTTQVVLALATNTDGLPLGYELFEGNKAEVKTLIATIDKWKEKFKIGDVCFIGDRAMFSDSNLEEMDKRGYKYIVAAKLRSLPEVMRNKILNSSGYKPAQVGDEMAWTGEFQYETDDIEDLKKSKATAKYISKYQETIEKNKERRFVVSFSEKRAICDNKKRSLIIEKIEKQLDKSADSAKLVSNAGVKKYTSNVGKSQAFVDQSKIDADSVWDGFHGVITNTASDKATPGQVLMQYKRLVKIEDCFRVNKTTLKMRPIYHFKPERIRAHVAICYMAFSIVRQLEYRVRLMSKLSISSIIEELNSVQSSIYVHKITKDRYRVPGHFSNEARKIYKSTGLTRNLNAHIMQ